MEKILISNILNWTKSTLILGKLDVPICNFSTDTRTIAGSDFFIPIRGENYNGHDFILEAVRKGAKGFVYDKSCKDKENLISFIIKEYPEIVIIECKDTLNFLKETAKGYIKKFNVISIGITGSSGKTTTKNFIVNILKKSFNTVYSQKNFNNEIGIPKTIFEINKNTRYFVAELGMRAKGQIRELSEICNLNYGIITEIGPSHLEFFNNMDEIALAKAEISGKIFENNGFLFLNANSKFTDFIEKNIKCRAIRCGGDPAFEYNFSNCTSNEFAFFNFDLNKYDKKIASINLNIPGYHNISNALLAAGLCIHLNMDLLKIKNGIEETTAESLRMEIQEKDGKVILNDCYNANPLSLRSAIDTLSIISFNRNMRSVAIIGDMLELGKESCKLHEEIGEYLVIKGINVLVCLGENTIDTFNSFNKCAQSAAVSYHFKTMEELLSKIGKIVQSGDAILIKGSRANKMENIIHYI